MNKAGYSPYFYKGLHVENKENICDIKAIIMIVVCRTRDAEIHFFDSNFPYRICYNDGSIFRESEYFRI